MNIKSMKTIILVVAVVWLQSFVPAQAVLVGQWNFNENMGTTSADASGNGNNAVLGETMGWGPGAVANDYSGVFDGTLNATVNYGTSSLFNIGQTFALAIWVKPVYQTGEQLIFGKGYSFSLSYYNNDVYFYGNGLAAQTALAANTWSHVVGVFDTGLATIYINGVFATMSNTMATIPDTTDVALTSGQNLYPPNQFMGSLSQAQIYNSTLTAGQVSTLYTDGPVIVPEPSTSALLAMAGIGVFWFARKKDYGYFLTS
jgi:hypothetical protein